MSIALLMECAKETRRLAIAGSSLAIGDFRLKKLIQPLQKSGTKAPVFAKVAAAIQNVVESEEKIAADALLKLTTLVNAILYTQGKTGKKGELEPLEESSLKGATTNTSCKVLQPLIAALTSTGSGRDALIRDGFERGLFKDLRLVNPAIIALGDKYSEISVFIATTVLPQYGESILPIIERDFNCKGKGVDGRRLMTIYNISSEKGMEYCREACENGSREVILAAIECLKDSRDREAAELLIGQTKARSKEVRAKALQAVSQFTRSENVVKDAVEIIVKGIKKKNLSTIDKCVLPSATKEVIEVFYEESGKLLAKLLDGEGSDKDLNFLYHFLSKMEDLNDDDFKTGFLITCLKNAEKVIALKSYSGISGRYFMTEVFAQLLRIKKKATLEALVENRDLGKEFISYSLKAACEIYSPAKVYDIFSVYLDTSETVTKKQQGMANAIVETFYRNCYDEELKDCWDPRWGTLAIQQDRLEMAIVLTGPGKDELNAYILEKYKKESREKRSKIVYILAVAKVENIIDLVIKQIEELNSGRFYYYELSTVMDAIPFLSLDDIPRLEALVPNLSDTAIEMLLDKIAELKKRN